jgi:O-antigen/teichoic acid export membrane protein
MSLTRRIFFGAAASWFSRGVTILLGLVLLPVLFRVLPQEELGIWLLLGQSWAAMGILDLGFGVTLTRQIAFAKGKSGHEPDGKLTESTLSEIADILVTGKHIYRALALISFIISFGLGAIYLNTLSLGEVPVQSVWIAWGMLCLSFAVNTWAAPWGCLIQGVGYVGWDAILLSFVNALTLCGQIAAAVVGGGLIGLAGVSVLGTLAQLFVFLMFVRRKRPELFIISGRWQKGLFQSMIPFAARAWLTAAGTSMILYTDQFIIASFKGAAELPAYRAAWILVHNLTILAATFAGASGVFVSHLWQAEKLPQIHGILERNARLGWLLMLAAAAVLLFAGQDVLTLWLGQGNFGTRCCCCLS